MGPFVPGTAGETGRFFRRCHPALGAAVRHYPHWGAQSVAHIKLPRQRSTYRHYTLIGREIWSIAILDFVKRFAYTNYHYACSAKSIAQVTKADYCCRLSIMPRVPL